MELRLGVLRAPGRTPRALQRAERGRRDAHPHVVEDRLIRAREAHRVGVVGGAEDLLERVLVEEGRSRRGIGEPHERVVDEVHDSALAPTASSNVSAVSSSIRDELGSIS